jgi:thioredoxin reductase (NADPH)
MDPQITDSALWLSRRQVFLLEMSRPDVFAAGDMRLGSIKRVTSVLGGGSMAEQFVHEYLNATPIAGSD